MGWGRMLLLGNWGQQMDIEDQKQEIEELRQKLETRSEIQNTTLESRIVQLEIENSELRLYLASLIKYLGHKGVLRQDELRTLVEAVDTEDGSYRGRIMK